MLLVTVSFAHRPRRRVCVRRGSALTDASRRTLTAADGALKPPAIAISPPLPVFTALVLSFLLGLFCAGKTVFARLFDQGCVDAVMPYHHRRYRSISGALRIVSAGEIVPSHRSDSAVIIASVRLCRWAGRGIVTGAAPCRFSGMLPAWLTHSAQYPPRPAITISA